MFNALNLYFKKLSDPELLVLSGTVSSSVENHPALTDPWPAAVTSISTLRELTETFRRAYDAAANGDHLKIELRKEARAAVEKALTKIGGYIIIVADGDMKILSTVGFQVKATTSKSSKNSVDLVASAKVIVRHSNLSGVLVVNASKVPGAVSCELQIASGDPNNEASWGPAGIGIFTRWKKLEVAGLTPGTKYYFRLRGYGANGPGPWSAVVSLYCM